MDTDIELAKRYANDFVVIGRDLGIQVAKLTISGQKDLDKASVILKSCQTTEGEIEEIRVKITKPINEFLKECNTLFKETTEPVLDAKAKIKAKIVTYNEKIEKQRREKEEAARKAEESRLAKIEAERKEREDAERKKREEEEKILAEKQKKLDEKEAKLEADRLEVERQKREIEEQQRKVKEDEEAAEQKRKAEEESARLASIKVKGLTKRMEWSIENEKDIPRIFCSPDSKKINQAIKAGVRTIAGIKIYEATSVK